MPYQVIIGKNYIKDNFIEIKERKTDNLNKVSKEKVLKFLKDKIQINL